MRHLVALAGLAGMLALWIGISRIGMSQQPAKPGDIGPNVQQFLDTHRGSWHDLNIPEADGRELHRIIVAHGYKSALEIGTSTGHSGIWIAWALSKTGGKLLTIEIDRDRHLQALANFKAAGVAPYIDARLGNAHEIVPALQGPFDIVFSDADKDWYVNYAKAILPKLSPGGCLVTHNVSERGWGSNAEYLQFLRSQSDLETTLFTGGGGMSVSYKKSKITVTDAKDFSDGHKYGIHAILWLYEDDHAHRRSPFEAGYDRNRSQQQNQGGRPCFTRTRPPRRIGPAGPGGAWADGRGIETRIQSRF